MKCAEIGRRIKSLRKGLKLSQGELARALGVKPVTISDYERGRVNLPATRLVELCRIFDVSADSLLGIGSAQKIHNQEVFGYRVVLPVGAKYPTVEAITCPCSFTCLCGVKGHSLEEARECAAAVFSKEIAAACKGLENLLKPEIRKAVL